MTKGLLIPVSLLLVFVVLASGCTQAGEENTLPSGPVQSNQEAEALMRDWLSLGRAMPSLEANLSIEMQTSLKGIENAIELTADSLLFIRGWKTLRMLKTYNMGRVIEEYAVYNINESYYQCNSTESGAECQVLDFPDTLTYRETYDFYESLLNNGKVIFPDAPRKRRIGGQECTEIFYYLDVKKLTGDEEAKAVAMGGFNAMPNFDELKDKLESYDELSCITDDGVTLESITNIILDDSGLSNFSMRAISISSHTRGYKIGAELPDSLFELPAEPQ